MALSFVNYTGNGSNRVFNLTFSYLQPADVSVKVNNVAVTFTFLDSSRVQTSVAPASGASVTVRRTTTRTARVVDFVDGALLTESALDADSNQLFNLSQEAFDASANALPLVFDQTYDATTKRIKNVADPTSAQDAATKNWVETAQTSSVSIATTKAAEASSATASANSASGAASSTTAAANSATASANSATAALASKNTSAAQAAISTTKAGQAASSATAAANSATASANSATAAASSASTANTKASQATTSANNAASSLASFTGQYVSQSGAPASPSTGDLWFDTSSSTMKVYNGSAFANAGSSVNGVENAVQHTATAGQTSFSATYDAGHLQVFLNGIRLDTADYTATNGNAVVLAIAAAVGDVVFIQGFGTFTLADHYTKSAADARFEPIDSAYTKSEANGRFKSISASEGGPSLGTNSVIRVNAKVIDENITFNNQNGSSVGPITVAANRVITIDSGSTWVII